MLAEGVVGAEQPGLRRNYLGFWHIAAQSVANIAPSATPALVLPLIFGLTGNGSWLAYVFATIALVLVALNVNQFTRRSVSPGSLYTFVGQGLGPTWGVISGWSMVIAYLIIGGSVLAGLSNYATVVAHAFVGQRFDFGLTIVAMTTAAIGAWYIAYRDVKLSTQFMLAIEFMSITLILLLSVIYFGKNGTLIDPEQFKLSGVTPGNLGHALVLAIFSYVGFESAASLGHEAKDPLHSIPRSVLFTVFAVGAYFVYTSYVIVLAFHGQRPPLDQSNAPLSVLSSLAGIPVFGFVIAIGVGIGFFACALACITAGSRVLFAMARHGLLHASVGDAHETHATPHVAVTIAAIVVLAAPLALFLNHFALLDIFGDLGTLGTISVLFSYVLVSIAAPAYLRRRGELNAWSVLVGALAVIAMITAIAGNVYPVPPPPQDYIPYIFVMLLAIGVGWFLIRRSQRPGMVDAIRADLETT
jgi:amino acid transporter